MFPGPWGDLPPDQGDAVAKTIGAWIKRVLFTRPLSRVELSSLLLAGFLLALTLLLVQIKLGLVSF